MSFAPDLAKPKPSGQYIASELTNLGNDMRRRNMIAGTAALLASPAMAEENNQLPSGLPDGTKQIARLTNMPDKRQLLQLADRPPNYETPVDVFTNTVTPNDRFFIRYHLAGVPSVADLQGWDLSITGDAIDRPVRLTMNELLGLPAHQVSAVCQCAGNRRGLSVPHVAGVQWGDGAMGGAVWRGPALRDVLKACGVKAEAVEVWLGGADKPVLDATPPFRKSIPIERAMDPDTIVAVAMNDAPIPLMNGFPARLVVPGWVGTYWMKHLTTIEVSTKPLASFWMKNAYRVPAGMFPVDHPFKSQATETSVPITEIVVNSLIADPLVGSQVDRSGFTITGIAWDRGSGIGRVEISLDGGQSWQDATLDPPLGPYAYRRFSLRTAAIGAGSHQLMSRATSGAGETQVDRLKANPAGYHNNVPRTTSVVAA